ncbi:MAG: hypothetical protein HY951_07950 [Bacteroidia bacterium]|nr:hypothetical protein [Bacteroidia bacterium]
MKLRLKINWLRIFNILIVGILIIIIARNSLWKKEDRVIEWDVVSYYAYVPAAFIHHDLSLDFFTKNKQLPGEIYWPLVSPTGKPVIKTTMGLAIMYSPFFLIAHAITPYTKYPANGFSQPYKQLLVLSSVIYLLFGLYFLRKFLQYYFNKYLIGITILSIVLGTNLLIYSTYFSTTSHIYSFFLFCTFIYFTKKWYSNPSIIYSIIIGLLIGLISLIRPTNIIISVFFIFFEVDSLSKLKERFYFYFRNYKLIITIILFSIVIWMPQIIYWKMQAGQYFYFSYQNERFFFNKLNILNNLFSFRNGWLLYTPLMILSLMGIPILLKNKFMFYPIFIFTILNIYIISSWWCWWYTGYGNRAYIESYAILSIPFIILLSKIQKWNKIIFILTLHIIFLLIGFNLFQSRQYYKGSIHYDSMTKESYWASFGKIEPTLEYYNACKTPNHNNAKVGINEDLFDIRTYYCGAEKLDSCKSNFISEANNNIKFLYSLNRTTEERFKGDYAIKLSQSDPYGFTYIFKDFVFPEKIDITVWMLDKKGGSNAGIVCSSVTPGLYYNFGNTVIKTLPNGWKKIELKLELPYFRPEDIKVFVMNQEINPVYFDNLLIVRHKLLSIPKQMH